MQKHETASSFWKQIGRWIITAWLPCIMLETVVAVKIVSDFYHAITRLWLGDYLDPEKSIGSLKTFYFKTLFQDYRVEIDDAS